MMSTSAHRAPVAANDSFSSWSGGVVPRRQGAVLRNRPPDSSPLGNALALGNALKQHAFLAPPAAVAQTVGLCSAPGFALVARSLFPIPGQHAVDVLAPAIADLWPGLGHAPVTRDSFPKPWQHAVHTFAPTNEDPSHFRRAIHKTLVVAEAIPEPHRREVTQNVGDNSTEPLGGEVPFAAIIRGLLERGELKTARTTLAVALAETSPNAELRKLDLLLRPTCVTPVRRQDTDRSDQIAVLARHASEVVGPWVAVGSSGMIATDGSLKGLMAKVKVLGVRELPLIHRL